MRSTRIQVLAGGLAQNLLQRNPTRKIFMLINNDALNAIGLQWGNSGDIVDFWPVPAGQVFVLDPTNPIFALMIQDDIFIVSPSGNAVNCYMLVG